MDEVLLLFSHSVVSDSLQPYEVQHTRLPCCWPSPRACSNSCPLSQWCHPTILSSLVPFSSCLPSVFPSIRVFSNESALHIRWPKYWSFSFSISPSREYSGLISFRTGTQESSPTPQIKNINSSALSMWIISQWSFSYSKNIFYLII